MARCEFMQSNYLHMTLCTTLCGGDGADGARGEEPAAWASAQELSVAELRGTRQPPFSVQSQSAMTVLTGVVLSVSFYLQAASQPVVCQRVFVPKPAACSALANCANRGQCQLALASWAARQSRTHVPWP